MLALSNKVSLNFHWQWHPTISQADEKWTEDMLNSKLGGKSFDQIGIRDFATVFRGALQATLATSPKERTISGLVFQMQPS
jgi:hypothetical protein